MYRFKSKKIIMKVDKKYYRDNELHFLRVMHLNQKKY